MTLHLGIDLACREAHRASLTDSAGRLVWRNRRFHTGSDPLEKLWAAVRAVDPDAPVTVVLEPTRNAWVPVASWLRGRGAVVELVPSEQAADLRRYYTKHVKNDRLDSELLARLPLLHPDGLLTTQTLGPAQAMHRGVGRRAKLVTRRTGCLQRLDALLELLGPQWFDAVGSDPGKAALAVLERYADPQALLRLGKSRLTRLLIRTSRGAWREDKADQLLAAAKESLAIWAHGGLDFAELAEDIAAEARLVGHYTREIDLLEERLGAHYDTADPAGIIVSTPGVRDVLAAAILGRLGDAKRFRDLAGVRSYTGLVPGVEQSGLTDHRRGPTKAGDPVLRQALFLAADHARKADPTLAARYQRLRAAGKHHNSALCTLAAVLITRIAACWRNDERYVIRDLDGNPITEEQGRVLCAAMTPRTAATATPGTGRRSKESRSAPSTGPSANESTEPRRIA